MPPLIKDLIESRIQASIQCKQQILLDQNLVSSLIQASRICAESIRQGGKIIFAGNGGSFADSQHLSAEFVSRLFEDRNPYPSLALGTNSSTITSIANDYSYEQIFSRELECIGQNIDVFFPISTSGNSLNIIKSIHTANSIGIKTFGFTSSQKGKITELCTCFEVPSCVTTTVQESHIMLGHILCELTEYLLLERVS